MVSSTTKPQPRRQLGCKGLGGLSRGDTSRAQSVGNKVGEVVASQSVGTASATGFDVVVQGVAYLAAVN